MRLRRIALAVLALAVVTSGCAREAEHDPVDGRGPSTDATTPRDPDAAVGPEGFRPEPIAWARCGAFQCASVQVPLDYSNPGGSKIELSVSRARATGTRIGALFVNPGGPGGSAVQFAQSLPDLLPDIISERFDLVGVEPRGLRGSAPLTCGVDYTNLYGADPTVEDAADRDALLAGAQQLADRCSAGSGAELAHVGTRDVARDLDAVRAAMGEAQISYYGASYGTAIGQVYADLFPSRVRAMVLDGVVELGPSGLDVAAQQAAGFEVALQRFAADCASSGCTTKDPIRAVERVQELVERPGGIPAPDADRAAGPGELNLGLGDALYSQSSWPILDRALTSALAGDGSTLVKLADHYLGFGSFDLYFAVNCLDYSWPTGDPDAILSAAKAAAVASPHFGEALTTDYLRCVDWPVPPDPLVAVTAPGAPPILVVSTTGDPATPYESGVAVAQHLESGVLLTNEGDGHTAVTGASSCVAAHFIAYLVDLNAPADGTTCR